MGLSVTGAVLGATGISVDPVLSTMVTAAAGSTLVAVVLAVLVVAAAEYLFEVGYRLIVRRTSLRSALRLEGPLQGMWSPLIDFVRRRRRGAGSGSSQESDRKGP